jgi:hypothetical protein
MPDELRFRSGSSEFSMCSSIPKNDIVRKGGWQSMTAARRRDNDGRPALRLEDLLVARTVENARKAASPLDRSDAGRQAAA